MSVNNLQMGKPTTDCDSQYPGLMSEDEALRLMLERVAPVKEIVDTDLTLALGRILAKAQTSLIHVPPHDNSAVDGYTVASTDIPTKGEVSLRVTQRIPAGKPAIPLIKGSAARIFTGAPVPQGADTVIMQEECKTSGDTVIIPGPAKPGMHVRKMGEDIVAGSEILKAGIKILPQDIGLAASVGIAKLPVYRKVKVAMFTTGDELVSPGNALEPGKIYNSNRYMLIGLLQMLGCTIIDLGSVPDNLAATRTLLEQATPQADLIITTGGVSVGDEDHVRSAVEQLGQLELWRIALKPGKPLTYGKIGTTHFIGLPGNPVSSFVTFCIIARPFILRLQGRTDLTPKALWASAEFERKNPIIRREYLRARFETAADHSHRVSIYPNQSSGVLTSASWANCLAIVPEQTTVTRGQKISVIPFSELFT